MFGLQLYLVIQNKYYSDNELAKMLAKYAKMSFFSHLFKPSILSRVQLNL